MKLKSLFSGILLAASISSVIGICINNPKADTYGDWNYATNYGNYLYGYTGNDTEVTIPYKVNSITIDSVQIKKGSDESNENLKNVKKVTFESGYKIISGSAISGFENVEELVIPEGTTEISSMAFYDLKNLKKVQLPSSLKILGNNAFKGCSSLESITIPEGVETLEWSAFSGCTGLKSVTLPDSLKEMGCDVFQGCLGLKDENGCVIVRDRLYYMDIPSGETEVTIPDGIKVLEGKLFSYKSGIKKVIIPKSVTRIEHRVFEHCGGLKEIVVPDSVEYIGTYAFSDCHALENITLPSHFEHGLNPFRGSEKLADDKGYIIINGILCDYFGTEKDISIPDGVKEIEQAAMFNKNITSVKMPESVEMIESDAFCKCGDLKKVEMPDSVTEWGNGVFQYCSSLSEVKLSNNLKTIESYAFDNTPSLKEIIIPEGVEEIRNNAFSDSDIETITLPSSLKSISNIGLGDNVKVVFNGSYEQWKNIKGIDSLSETIEIDFASPTSVPTSTVTSTPVPETATPTAAVTSVPESSPTVTAAPENTVTAAPSPEAAVSATPAPVISAAPAVTVQPTVTPVSDTFKFKGNTYKIKGKNAALVKGAKKAKVSIPATVKYLGKKYKVSEIGASAFKSNKKLKSVTIGKNVKVIGNKAFFGDKKLSSVTIKSKLLKSSKVGKNAFKGVSKVVVFKVPAAKKKAYSKIIARSLKKYKIK